MMRLFLLVFLILAFLAVRYLPWWGLLLSIFAMVVAARLLVPWLLKRGLMSLFNQKSRTLKGAGLEIHEIIVTEPPETEGETPDPRPHYRIDATITPRTENGALGHWEPGELMCVRPGTPTLDKSEGAQTDDVAQIVRLDIESEGKFTPDEGLKFNGPVRLRLWVAAAPTEKELTLRYYFEDLGTLMLPEAARNAATG